MAVLTANNLGKDFGAETIFNNVTVEIPRGSRIALVGPNGAGKTTLLHILIGEQSASRGEVNPMKQLRVGFLPQRPELLGKHTLYEEALRAFDDLRERERELDELAEQMAAGDEDAIRKYGKKQEQFEEDGGYTYEGKIQTVLGGLGFDEDELNMPLTQLSGGQKTRAVLARLLLEAPDLLALDEPTNHLDIDAIEWLEGYLKTFEGAVLAISHDRYFIDAFASTVWALEFGRVEIYRANYTQYLQQREERRERRRKEYEAQQAFIEKEEEYIRRNIAGQNTKQAQGRRTRLERLKRDELVQAPKNEKQKMKIDLQIAHRGNEYVLKTHGLQVGYADDTVPLLDVQNIKLERGEIAALVGPNGVGKSTFIKTVTGQLPPFAGAVEVGDLVEVGYFAQAHEQLNPEKSVIEEIMGIQRMTPGEARDYLARYLFRGEDVFRRVSSLSGGERGRVALAKLALGTANLLLLDEPTNHLDIPAQEVLEDMLSEYPGTVLVVSHDRYLIDALATQVWAARPPAEDDTAGRVHVFHGSWTEYAEHREQQRLAQQAAEAEAKRAAAQKTQRRSNSGKSKDGLNDYQRQKRVAAVEEHITELETRLEEITTEIDAASAAGDAATVQALGEEYTQTETDLDAAMTEWESLLDA